MRTPLIRFLGLWLVMALLVAPAVVGQDASSSGVTFQDLLDGLKNPSRWLSYSGDYTGRRHSPLTQITPENVHRLAAQWTFQAETIAASRGFENTPIVLDNVLYVTGSNNYAWALDARTGRPFWKYRRDLPKDLTYGASAPVNRGFGVLGDRLFMTTLDAHLLAFDMRRGTILWDTVLADYKIGYAATGAPMVVKDKVIVGSGGGEWPTRGFIDAYDPKTGNRVWRFNTIPLPGEPGSETWPSAKVMDTGGGQAWMPGSYDPDLNTIYWGTGQPYPVYVGVDRPGDNLYTGSIVALDADTGKLKWYYQFTPHDTHDWDATQVPVLAELTLGGQPRKVVMLANRNGFFYVLDRVTGKVLLAKKFADTQWASEIGPDGRPVLNPETPDTCLPDMRGATNFMPPSFDPVRRLFFVTVRETCAFYFTWTRPDGTTGAGMKRRDGARADTGRDEPARADDRGYGALRAIDPTTGERRWEFRFETPGLAGVMSTAAGLVFAGDNEGNFSAFDALTGKSLWHYPTGSALWGAGATTFMLDGRQFVLIPSGSTLTAFALPPTP
jgi:alcohol dehydrogenase (cytochrome c)